MSSYASPERFNVVILYEQRAFVGRAMSTYFHLQRELGSNFESELRIWRIDAMTLAEFAAEANRDVEAADVIILAVHGGQPCPPPFQNWQTTAGSRPGVPRRAVIAIAETFAEPTPAAESWTSMLRGSATQIHPEIFVWDPPEERAETIVEPEFGRLSPGGQRSGLSAQRLGMAELVSATAPTE